MSRGLKPRPPGSAPSNSLERALVILERIAKEPRGLSNKQISQELHIATSSCSYILNRLEREGYLSRNPGTSRYEIGLKVIAIARGALRQVNFARVAQPTLRRFSSETGLDSLIGVLDQNRLLVVTRVQGEDFQSADVDTGTEFPAHALASGKVLLAHLPEEEIPGLIGREPLTKLTGKTVVDPALLIAELDLVRKQGHAVSDGEFSLGIRSITAPILDSGYAVRAALAAIGPTGHPFWRDQPAAILAVKTAAREISRAIRSLPVDRFLRR